MMMMLWNAISINYATSTCLNIQQEQDEVITRKFLCFVNKLHVFGIVAAADYGDDNVVVMCKRSYSLFNKRKYQQKLLWLKEIKEFEIAYFDASRLIFSSELLIWIFYSLPIDHNIEFNHSIDILIAF